MPRPLPFLVKVLHDVGCGLLSIRATRVVHMDLKAANVVLDWAGPDSRYHSLPPHYPPPLPFPTPLTYAAGTYHHHHECIPLHGECLLVAVCGCGCALGRYEMSSVGHGGLIREGYWLLQGFGMDVLLLFVLVRPWISMCAPLILCTLANALCHAWLACVPVPVCMCVLCVCFCVCMYVCMYVCMRACVSACLCACSSLPVCLCPFVCDCPFVCVCVSDAAPCPTPW